MSNATFPTGKSDARYETSAAVAQTEASTQQLSQEVEKNAEQVHDVTVDAAHSAELKAAEAPSAVNQLEENLSHKTNTAVAEGASDVQSAKATANSYLGQAKELAGSALATAQSYISGQPASTTQTRSGFNGTGATGNIQSTVQSAVDTSKGYLTSAANAAKPYVDSAVNAAQPYVAKANQAITGEATTSKPSEVPASTAPLESGPNVVGNPYPATTNGHLKVAEL